MDLLFTVSRVKKLINIFIYIFLTVIISYSCGGSKFQDDT
jgi:hypothetical protein